MDPSSSSSSLSSTIAYVVDPKKERKKTCIPFTSHGYLCVRTVGGKPCTVGTVRTTTDRRTRTIGNTIEQHTQVRSCFCYSRRTTLLDGTQSCELIASDDDIYHNGLLGRRSWSRCVCGDRGGSSTNRTADVVSSIFVFIFWFCVVLFLLVSLYVQIFVRCCSSSSTNRKSGYVRVGQDDESRKMRRMRRRRRRRRRTSVGKKGDRVEYTAVNLMDDDDDDDGGL